MHDTTINRPAADPRAEETLLLVERFRELRRRRRSGELSDEELSEERLRLLERRKRAMAWHGPERRAGRRSDRTVVPLFEPVEPAMIALPAGPADPFAALRHLASSVGEDARRNRAAALLDAVERTRRDGYQEVNGVTMSRRAARFAQRELG